MWIQKLHIHNFGKLHQTELTFTDGINIVYGDNEAGKTTVHTFIKSMFFGVLRHRGRAAASDEYTKYEPWSSPACYEGSMEFARGSDRYKIRRNFQKNTKSVSLTDMEVGRKISDADDCMEELIPGMNENNYNSTVSVSQGQREISSIITNLNQTRSSDINVQQALDILNGQKKEMDQKKQALGIEEIISRLKEYDDISQEAETLNLKIRQLHMQKKNVQEELRIQLQAEQKRAKETMNDTVSVNAGSRPVGQRSMNSNSSLGGSAPRDLDGRNGLDRILDILTVAMVAAFVAGLVTERLLISLLAGICFVICILVALRMRKKQRKSQYRTQEENEETDLFIQDPTVPVARKVEVESAGIRQKLQQVQTELERAEWEKDSLLEKSNRREQLKEELEEKNVLLDQYNRQIQSIMLAISTIRRHAKNIESDFGDNLNDMASEYISRFTRGKYDDLCICDGMKVTVSEEGHVVDMNSVSYATKEQIRLSVRLAASRILFQGEKLPLILDEAFAHFDHTRLEDTLLSLAAMKTQIIIFTCTNREIDVLNNENVPFNLVKLD